MYLSAQTRACFVKAWWVIPIFSIFHFIGAILITANFSKVSAPIFVFFFLSSLCQIIFAWKNTHYIIWKWFLGGGILDWFVGTLALHMLHADIQQDMLLFFAGLWLSVKGTGMIGYTTAIKNLKVKSWSFLLILSVLELILSLGVMISSHMDNNTRIYLAAFSLLLLGSYFFILIFSMKNMEYKEKNHFFYYE